MKWIVITLPEFIRNEAGYIEQLLKAVSIFYISVNPKPAWRIMRI